MTTSLAHKHGNQDDFFLCDSFNALIIVVKLINQTKEPVKELMNYRFEREIFQAGRSSFQKLNKSESERVNFTNKWFGSMVLCF